MFLTIAASLVLIQGGPYRTDTTVTVQSGTRLALSAMGGEVVLRAWDRNQVRIRASHSSNTTVEIRSSGAVLRLEATGRMGMPGRTDFELTVPAWMGTDFDGMNFDLDVEGVTGGIKASTLNGDLLARGGADVSFNTMNGQIRVDGSRGRVSVSAVSGRIEITGASGDVDAETVSGNVGLYRIESSRVNASSLSGQVIYQGAIRDNGSYTFGSHSGTVTLAIPSNANATVNTSTMSGGMSASFSLPAMDQRSRGRTTVRFGNGSASIEVESFSGNIRLVRPEEAPTLPERRRSNRSSQRDEHDWHFGDGLAGEVLRGFEWEGLGDLIDASVSAGLSGLSAWSFDFDRPVPPIPPTIRWEW
ncbi:MAG: DUF4097 domain-containing protein [Gemmatimonadales bacterium]